MAVRHSSGRCLFGRKPVNEVIPPGRVPQLKLRAAALNVPEASPALARLTNCGSRSGTRRRQVSTAPHRDSLQDLGCPFRRAGICRRQPARWERELGLVGEQE